MLDVRLSTWRFSPSSASAWQPRSGIQKSRRKRARSSRGALLELLGERSSSQTSRARRAAAPLGVVDVALDLAGRDRPLRERAVGELDRVPAVLPALVDQARRGVAALVLDVAVAVEVAAVLDPSQRGASVRLQLANQRVVAGPAVVLVEQDRNSGVASALPKYGECGRSPREVSSPKRSSCRILPGSCSWKSSRVVA